MSSLIEMNYADKSISGYSYCYKSELTEPGYSSAIKIRCDAVNSISANLSTPDSGSGKIQITNSPYDDIIDDSAIWEDYENGSRIEPAISAIRQQNISGTTILNVRAC